MTLHLSPAELNEISIILRDYCLKYQFDLRSTKFLAFGSRVAENTPKKFSDLDIAIVTSRPLTIIEMGDLREIFSESDLPIKVDISNLSDLPPTIQRKIQQIHFEINLD